MDLSIGEIESSWRENSKSFALFTINLSTGVIRLTLSVHEGHNGLLQGL